MVEANTSVVEFNSNVAVLKRCSDIIDHINDARFRTTQFDKYGSVLGHPEEIVSHLICLYKEVSVEKEGGYKEIWTKLMKLRDKLRVKPPSPRKDTIAYWRKTIDQVDELDIELRAITKKHGFLSSNKRDVSKAALRR